MAGGEKGKLMNAHKIATFAGNPKHTHPLTPGDDNFIHFRPSRAPRSHSVVHTFSFVCWFPKEQQHNFMLTSHRRVKSVYRNMLFFCWELLYTILGKSVE